MLSSLYLLLLGRFDGIMWKKKVPGKVLDGPGERMLVFEDVADVLEALMVLGREFEVGG